MKLFFKTETWKKEDFTWELKLILLNCSFKGTDGKAFRVNEKLYLTRFNLISSPGSRIRFTWQHSKGEDVKSASHSNELCIRMLFSWKYVVVLVKWFPAGYLSFVICFWGKRAAQNIKGTNDTVDSKDKKTIWFNLFRETKGKHEHGDGSYLSIKKPSVMW